MTWCTAAIHCNTWCTLRAAHQGLWENVLYDLTHNILQHTATCCNARQHTATHCNTLQHTATHCNTMYQTVCVKDCGRKYPMTTYHAATHCNTLQHTIAHMVCVKNRTSRVVNESTPWLGERSPAAWREWKSLSKKKVFCCVYYGLFCEKSLSWLGEIFPKGVLLRVL